MLLIGCQVDGWWCWAVVGAASRMVVPMEGYRLFFLRGCACGPGEVIVGRLCGLVAYVVCGLGGLGCGCTRGLLDLEYW